MTPGPSLAAAITAAPVSLIGLSRHAIAHYTPPYAIPASSLEHSLHDGRRVSPSDDGRRHDHCCCCTGYDSGRSVDAAHRHSRRALLLKSGRQMSATTSIGSSLKLSVLMKTRYWHIDDWLRYHAEIIIEYHTDAMSRLLKVPQDSRHDAMMRATSRKENAAHNTSFLKHRWPA